MAAKRFAGVQVNWKTILDKFPKDDEGQMAKLMKIKKNHETFVRKVAALPEKPLSIDWSAYKNKISPAFVDSIKQKYEAIQIPYPKDNVAGAIDAHEKELAQKHENLKVVCKKRITECEEKLVILDNILPLSEMTLQEQAQAYPEMGPNVKYPTPCPTDPEVAKEWRIYIHAKERGLPAERPRG